MICESCGEPLSKAGQWGTWGGREGQDWWRRPIHDTLKCVARYVVGLELRVKDLAWELGKLDEERQAHERLKLTYIRAIKEMNP